MPTFRLYHKHNKKYVAWPCGRGFFHSKNPTYVSGPFRIENYAWGGTNDLPVLEMHSVHKRTHTVTRVYSLYEIDNNTYYRNRLLAEKKAPK